MRLSEWRKKAPTTGSLNTAVVAVLKPLFTDLGADADPECWVAWGEEPANRYSILAPSTIGLISLVVRPSDPEGPRATARLIRWSKLVVNELSIEASGGHRIVAVQVESYVLKGMDDEADRITQFVGGLIGSMDGRSQQAVPIAVIQGVVARSAVGAVHPAPAAARASGANAIPKKAAPKPVAHSKPAHVAKTAVTRTAREPVAAATESGPESVAAGKLALVPVQPAPTAPAVKPKRLTPIAAGVAAARNRGRPGAQPAPHPRPQPEPEPDRSEWIGPHPIEPPKPSAEPKRPPRPWMP